MVGFHLKSFSRVTISQKQFQWLCSCRWGRGPNKWQSRNTREVIGQRVAIKDDFIPVLYSPHTSQSVLTKFFILLQQEENIRKKKRKTLLKDLRWWFWVFPQCSKRKRRKTFTRTDRRNSAEKKRFSEHWHWCCFTNFCN